MNLKVFSHLFQSGRKTFSIITAIIAIAFMHGAVAAPLSINYLVINSAYATGTYSANMSPQYFLFVSGSSCTNIPNGYYGSDGSYSQNLPNSATYSMSINNKMTLSIVNTPPPPGTPVHYYGVQERFNTFNGNLYVAGVPASINIKPIYSDNPVAVSLNGPPVVINGYTYNNSWVSPAILLPDHSLINSTFQGAGTPWYGSTGGWNPISSGQWLGPPYQTGPYATSSCLAGQSASYQVLQAQSVSGSVSATPMITGGLSPAIPALSQNDPFGLLISSTANGGIKFNILGSGSNYSGQVSHVIGY